uniref:Tc1-like transposase DDE domain-containing protein n=1 Tax=Amphilophus citrinellus TaxID=61819 RepID=A0A3Q0RAY7_AMPCI
MPPTPEMSTETKERIIKLLKEGKSSHSVAQDVGCSQSAVSKTWTKYKQHGKVVKGMHTGRPRKTSKRQDRRLKAICLENRKCTTKQMRNKWEETGVNEMGFTYRNAKRKPSLTPKQTKTSDESRICIGKRVNFHTIERMFGDDEIIFQDNASCHMAKTVKTFLAERQIRSMSLPANSPDLNPIENLWWKLKKMVHDKAPACKADLATAIRESWSQIDEEYCLSLIKSVPQRLQAVIKASGGATKY